MSTHEDSDTLSNTLSDGHVSSTSSSPTHVNSRVPSFGHPSELVQSNDGFTICHFHTSSHDWCCMKNTALGQHCYVIGEGNWGLHIAYVISNDQQVVFNDYEVNDYEVNDYEFNDYEAPYCHKRDAVRGIAQFPQLAASYRGQWHDTVVPWIVGPELIHRLNNLAVSHCEKFQRKLVYIGIALSTKAGQDRLQILEGEIVDRVSASLTYMCTEEPENKALQAISLLSHVVDHERNPRPFAYDCFTPRDNLDLLGDLLQIPQPERQLGRTPEDLSVFQSFSAFQNVDLEAEISTIQHETKDLHINGLTIGPCTFWTLSEGMAAEFERWKSLVALKSEDELPALFLVFATRKRLSAIIKEEALSTISLATITDKLKAIIDRILFLEPEPFERLVFYLLLLRAYEKHTKPNSTFTTPLDSLHDKATTTSRFKDILSGGNLRYDDTILQMVKALYYVLNSNYPDTRSMSLMKAALHGSDDPMGGPPCDLAIGYFRGFPWETIGSTL